MTAVAELARTRTKLIHRMPGRGDLWIFVDGGAMLVRTDQLEALAGIPPWSGDEVLFAEDAWTTVDGHVCTPLEHAIARCESAASSTAAEFLAWLGGVLGEVDDDVLDKAQSLPGFIGSHPVQNAARQLSEDPALTIGRDGLFAFMHAQGWLSRGGDTWEVTHLARRNGWLTVRQVPIGRGRRTYPQTYVTPEGLALLRELLAESRRRHAPPDRPAPTLFD